MESPAPPPAPWAGVWGRGARGGWAAALYPHESLSAVSLRPKQELVKGGWLSLTGEKGIHKFLYVLNNCFLFCSAEQVIKRTFVRANLDHTCACVLWSCKPKHVNQPPIQEQME